MEYGTAGPPIDPKRPTYLNSIRSDAWSLKHGGVRIIITVVFTRMGISGQWSLMTDTEHNESSYLNDDPYRVVSTIYTELVSRLYWLRQHTQQKDYYRNPDIEDQDIEVENDNAFYHCIVEIEEAVKAWHVHYFRQLEIEEQAAL